MSLRLLMIVSAKTDCAASRVLTRGEAEGNLPLRRMSIVTKQGDRGQTALMYGLRVPKHHGRVEACGAVDELNAALGLARAQSPPSWLAEALVSVQRDLIVLMGELATDPVHRPRLVQDGFPLLSMEHVTRLEGEVNRLEEILPVPRDWALPGANPLSAALDFARAVCRRAERRVCALAGGPEAVREVILAYLNRLSDLLWLWARSAEQVPTASSSTAVANESPGSSKITCEEWQFPSTVARE